MVKNAGLFKRLMLAVLVTVCAVCATFTLATNGVKTASAAEFSYQEGRDGYGYTVDGLDVTFTVSYMEPGLTDGLIKWVVYLIHENTGITYNSYTHKYEDNNNRQRNVAAYYFLLNPSDAYDVDGNKVTANCASTFKYIVASNAHAYHASSSNPSNANDFGTDTGKTLAEVFEEENWIVGVGPMFANWWGSGGYGAPIDYYVGRAADVSRATVTFRDYNPNTVISSLNVFTNVNVTVPEYTEITDEGYEFLGWYCDTTEKIYSKAEVEALTVKEVVDSKTRTVNFYAAYKKTFGKYIEFTADILGEDTESDGDDTKITRVVNATDNITETVTVVYDITHNDGANSLLLVPEYDKEVFTIQSVTVKDDTVLDAATIGEDGKYKILLEGKTLYDALDEGFLSITYLINEDKVVNGDYTFGLKVNPRVENASSVAYYWLEGTKTGEQEEIGIVVITPETLALSAIKQSTIRSSDYTFTYSNTVVTPAKVDNYTYYSYDNGDLKVYFDYDGDAEEFTYVWYASNGSTVIDAPKYVGEYYLDITAPATNFYLSSNTRVKVTIVRRDVTVNIANKSSVYLNDLAALTYQIVGTVYEGDMTVALETTATSTSPVGNYAITASVSGDYANQYNITINNGNYTITARAITIKAENQSAQYTGSEPTVSQTAYTVTGVDASYVSNVAIAKEAGVNAGTYTLTPSVNLGSNFTVEFLEGTFTITSATTGANEIKQYFDGFDGDVEPYVLTYNGKYQLLVHAKEGTPEWVLSHIVASDAHYGRDAVEYNDVSVTLSFTADEAANFTNGEQSIVFTVDAVINKAAITVSADAKTANYGDDAKDLTYTITSGTLYGKAADNDYHNASALSDDTLNVTLTTKDGGNAIIIDNTTPVGTYDIVIGATNANYNITLVDGTYTIYKPVISDTDEDGNPDDASDDNLAHSGLKISLSATDVYYNRALVYSYKVMVGTQVLDGSAYTVKFYSDYACTNEVDPENFGTYYIKVAVADTDNYDGGSKVVSFEIMKIQLSAPSSVSYSGAVVTLSAVTTDVGGKALKEGTTVSYVINSVDCTSSRSYTSTAAAVYSYVVGSDNDNYIVYEGTTEECYSIAFTEGSHAYNPVVLEVPATLYCFNTSSINLPEALSLDGYNFASWGGKSAESVYAPAASIVLDALWNAIEYKVTYKYTDGGAVAYEHIFYYGDAATYPTADVVPVKDSDNDGIYYTFADKWTANDTKYTFTTAEGIATITGVTVSSNMTFVAVFDTQYNSFTVKYYISSNGATSGYSAYGDVQEYKYLDVINYLSVSESVVWFKVDAWYLNENRTEAVPATMPNHDIKVYGTYKFDIGAGDVNADGIVNADDITLYRQWIVGGYPMAVVENGDEWDTALSYNANTRYFLKRVADINADSSKDIRDVSITRMSIVNGYNWDILTGENVSGAEIVRTYQSITVNEIASRLNSGKRVILGDNIEDKNGVIEVNFSGNVYIDLNGKTLTVYSFAVNTDKKDATIIVKNGTIITTNGITVTAPNGNVILEDLIGYVNNSQINLQAASSSLHFAGAVEFYKEFGNTAAENVAPIYVAENTHVVVESSATVVVEKIKVATVTVVDDVPTFTADATKSIALENNTVNTVTVEGKNSCAVACIGETEYLKLQDAIDAISVNNAEAVTITLLADIDNGTGLATDSVNADGKAKKIIIDFNGHTYTMVTGSVGSSTTQTQAMHWAAGSNITLKNGTFIVAESAVNTVGANGFRVKMAIQNYGALTIENMTMNFANIPLDYYGTTENFDPVNGAYKKYSGLEIPNFNMNNGSSVVINNSTITFNSESSFGVYVESTATITNSTINGTVALSTDSTNASATITNSTVSGGVVSYFNGDGIVKDGNDYTVVNGVAAIGSTYYATLQAAIDAVPVNNAEAVTITLLADIDNGTGLITYDNMPKAITIDFNGHTYTIVTGSVGSSKTQTQTMHWAAGSEITLKNGAFIVAESAVNTDGANGFRVKMAMQNYGALTIENMTMNFANIPLDYYGTTGDFDPVNGAYKKYSGLEIPNFNMNNGSSVVINNSTITFNSESKFGVYVESTATITNSTINGTVALSTDSTNASATIIDSTVSGGVVVYFAGDVLGENANTYIVYRTLKEALENADTGATVYLTDDVTVTGTTVADRLTVTVDMTLDLNGHTLKSADGLEPTSNWSTLWVKNGAVVNIMNGTIGACYDTDGITDAPYGITVGEKNGTAGTVNLTNVNVNGGITAVQVILGEVNIYSGNYKASPYNDDYEYLLNCIDANYQAGTAVINVYGGTFENFNPADCAAEGINTNFVAVGYAVTENGGVYTVVAE